MCSAAWSSARGAEPCLSAREASAQCFAGWSKPHSAHLFPHLLVHPLWPGSQGNRCTVSSTQTPQRTPSIAQAASQVFDEYRWLRTACPGGALERIAVTSRAGSAQMIFSDCIGSRIRIPISCSLTAGKRWLWKSRKSKDLGRSERFRFPRHLRELRSLRTAQLAKQLRA